MMKKICCEKGANKNGGSKGGGIKIKYANGGRRVENKI
jgi:hypothetical protein